MRCLITMPGHDKDVSYKSLKFENNLIGQENQAPLTVVSSSRTPTVASHKSFIKNNYDMHKIDSFKNYQHLDLAESKQTAGITLPPTMHMSEEDAR